MAAARVRHAVCMNSPMGCCRSRTRVWTAVKRLEELLGRLPVIPALRKRPAFWMREFRRCCNYGHQTAILTTRQDLPVEGIAERMFARRGEDVSAKSGVLN